MEGVTSLWCLATFVVTPGRCGAPVDVHVESAVSKLGGGAEKKPFPARANTPPVVSLLIFYFL